ncbi:MAG: 30S ribosomal protein S6e [Methanotrichaceae archaeon]|nr:30S ribosomal protein S6e [Methanotrichaceae archaeon]
MDFRIVISDPKNGKAYQVELKEPGSNKFLGKRIGDRIEADILGLPGYAVQITGGSDREGFPMRADLPGTKRKRLLVAGGTGYHADSMGKKKRKSIHGREISSEIGQINVKVIEAGSKPVEELLGGIPKEEEK